jgi:hypothetical protein
MKQTILLYTKINQKFMKSGSEKITQT